MTTRTDAELGREAQLELQRNSVVKELSRVIRQRDALLAACREMLPYVEKASEVMFPNLADNEAIAEDARAAIAACEEKPE